MSENSKPHVRTRRDHRTETAEDYVEAVLEVINERGLCRVVDLAKRFAVSHVTVTKTVSRLKTGGYLASERYGPIELTRKGRRMAEASLERHRVVYEFLVALGITTATAEVDAEGMEHHVSEETLAKFKELVAEQRGG